MDGETKLTGIVLEEAIRIHRKYGPGLLESVYERLLAHALIRRGLHVRRQQPIPLQDDGLHIAIAYKADLLVENRVIIEVKALATNDPLHIRQLLTHIRLMDITVGLAINFGLATLMKGVKRVINTRHVVIPTSRWNIHYTPITLQSPAPPVPSAPPAITVADLTRRTEPGVTAPRPAPPPDT